MKHLFLFAACVPLCLAAQPVVTVSSASFSTGVHPTLSFEFEGADAKYVEAWWKDELKRVSRDVANKKEVVAAGALLPQVSRDTVRVLVKAEQRKGAPFVTAHVAMRTTQGWVAPGSDAAAYEAAKAYVQQQSTMLRRQLAQQELTTAEKGLAKLGSELDMMRREQERAEAGIEKAKQRAAEAVQEAAALATQADALAAKAEEQRKANSEASDAEGEKALADLMKQQARLQEKRRKAGDEEVQQRKKAQELAEEVRKNTQDQERKGAEIVRQEQLVKQLRDKLAAIR
jgi:hypothetical protein